MSAFDQDPSAKVDSRPLFVQLQEQRQKKQEAFDSQFTMGNSISYLDKDDAAYLEDVASERRRALLAVKQQEEEELRAFRKRTHSIDDGNELPPADDELGPHRTKIAFTSSSSSIALPPAPATTDEVTKQQPLKAPLVGAAALAKKGLAQKELLGGLIKKRPKPAVAAEPVPKKPAVAAEPKKHAVAAEPKKPAVAAASNPASSSTPVAKPGGLLGAAYVSSSDEDEGK